MVAAILGRKGGAGKSTTALHLAAALADLGPTALVDLDRDNATALDYAAAGRLPFRVADATAWDAGVNAEPWAHVVIDGYARPTPAQLAELARVADVMLLPTPPDAVSLRVLARTLPDVAATGARYAVVLALVPPRPSHEGDRALRDLRAGGVPVLTTTVPRAAAFTRGGRARRLAWDMPGGRRLVHVFDDLAREVIAHAEA